MNDAGITHGRRPWLWGAVWAVLSALALHLGMELSGFDGWLRSVPYLFEALLVLNTVVFGGCALILLFVPGDEEDPRKPSDWLLIFFMLLMAASQATMLISGAQSPSELFGG